MSSWQLGVAADRQGGRRRRNQAMRERAGVRSGLRRMPAKEQARHEEQNECGDQAEHDENDREGISLPLRRGQTPCHADHSEQAEQGGKRQQEISLHGSFSRWMEPLVGSFSKDDSSWRTNAFLVGSTPLSTTRSSDLIRLPHADERRHAAAQRTLDLESLRTSSTRLLSGPGANETNVTGRRQHPFAVAFAVAVAVAAASKLPARCSSARRLRRPNPGPRTPRCHMSGNGESRRTRRR